MVIPIPKGKKVIFQQDGGPIKGTEGASFILEEDLTLSFTSNFSPISKSSSPVGLKLLSSVMRDTGSSKLAGFLGGEFQQLGFQLWTDTSPLSLSLSLKLAMETDAKRDVVDPTMALTEMALPTLGDGEALIGPGPSILSAFKGSEKVSKYKQIHCYIGALKIPNIVITRANPTFSKEVDQHGYPIWASLEIAFTTLYSASDEMLRTIIGGVSI